MQEAAQSHRQISHYYQDSQSYDNQSAHPLYSKYSIEREIGHGAQGRIFLARRNSDHSEVVIKQLNIHSIKTWKEYELFHREADVLSSIKMPGVAKFYEAIDCLEDNPPCSYIVQEYINGSTLQKMLKDGHRFRVDDIYHILIQTLHILNQLHHHEPPIIHRDIKPSNLMITPCNDGSFKVTIIDFGAVANPQVQGGGSTVAGTFGYMPPEQLTGHPVPAGDIYALAAVAVQLFCGKSPADLPQKDFRLIFEPELQDKPHELVTLLGQMLDPNVEQRLADIPAIIQQLRRIQAGKNLTQSKVQTDKKSRYSSSFEEKLAQVNSIGQHGNIEIWQKLPNQVPREIPECYDNILRNYINIPELLDNTDFTLQSKIRQLKDIDQKIVDFKAFLKKVCTRVLPLCVGIGGLLIFGFLFIAVISKLSRDVIKTTAIILAVSSFVPVVGLIVITIIGLVILLLYQLYYKTANSAIGTNSHLTNLGQPNRFGVKEESMTAEMQMLLKSGRKSIAQIDDITYIPQKGPEFIRNPYHTRTNVFGHDVSAVCRVFYICQPPLFKVSYRFNPPDDRREEDIIHTFITHDDPENHYKKGDPLPILYKIEDNYFNDRVISMPFPLSEFDLQDPLEGKIIDSSCSAISQSNIDKNTDISHLFHFHAPANKSYIIDQSIYSIIQAKTISDLDDAITGCLCTERSECLALIPYLRTILLEDRVYPCHAKCILTLTLMAFPEDKKQCCIEAFNVIKEYLRQSPRSIIHPTSDASTWISYLIYIVNQHGYKSDLDDEFYNLLIDVILDPDVSEDVRKSVTTILDTESPKHIRKKTRDIVLNLDTSKYSHSMIKTLRGHFFRNISM